jgi:hypothetical protein
VKHKLLIIIVTLAVAGGVFLALRLTSGNPKQAGRSDAFEDGYNTSRLESKNFPDVSSLEAHCRVAADAGAYTSSIPALNEYYRGCAVGARVFTS